MEKISTPSPAATSRRAASQLLVVRREEPPIKTNHRALIAAYFIKYEEGTCADVREFTALLPSTINHLATRFCADGLLEREQIATQIGVSRVLYFLNMKIEEYGNTDHPVYKGLRYFTEGFHINKSEVPWTCRRNRR